MDKNEPAFPVHDCAAFQYSGMTLRDYFAGQALPSVMHLCARDTMIPGETIEASFARKSYALADALLIERERGQ